MNRQISLTLALAPFLVVGGTQAAMSVGGGGPRMDNSAPLIQVYQEPGAAPGISAAPDGGSPQAGWADRGRMSPPSGSPFTSGPGPGSYSAASSLPPPSGGYVGAPMMESTPSSGFGSSASRPNPPSDWMTSGNPGQGGTFPDSTWMGGRSPGGYAAPGQSGPGGSAYSGPGGGLPPPGGVYPGGTVNRFGSPWGTGAFPGGFSVQNTPGTEVGSAGTGPRAYPELPGTQAFPMGAKEPSPWPGPDRGGYAPAGSGWGPGGLAGPGPGGAPSWGPWSSMMADPLMMMLERHLDFMDRLDRIETKLQEILDRLPKSPTP